MTEQFLGTLEGRGKLHDPAQGDSDVEYNIRVFQKNGLMDGAGRLTGNMAFFLEAMESNSLDL